MHTEEVVEQGAPLSKATKALLLIHGRGAKAKDILPLARFFCDPHFYIAAPQATHQSWYPYSFMADEKLNAPWTDSAIESVEKLIRNTATYIPLEKIYIMGFSQGACLALESTAQFANRYGGVVAFTGGLIGKTIQKEKYHGDFAGTPIFIGTDDQDSHVPLERTQQSCKILEDLGAKVTLKIYPGMGHTISQEEIQWVQRHIFKYKTDA
ncbi:MAG: phospholipase [Chlamydiales bacterium 38-26]|nr:dienelactone hydrolase family protein [Chlamydiales bacterium]OJV08135.1 MAG: phospholipase [Chlamydiales bacterium 38-26]